MKNKKILMVAVMMLVAGAIFYSCQKEQNTLPVKEQGTMMLKGDCDCVEQITPVIVDVKGGGSAPRPKIGEIKMWNDNSKVYLTIGTFSFDYIKMVGFLASDASEPSNPVYNQNVVSGAGTSLSLDYDIPSEWAFCVEYRFWIRIEGKAGGTETYSINYIPYEICQDCDESFSYTTTDNLHVVFTYISEIDLEDAILKFTCPQIDYYTANDAKTYSPNPGQMNGTDNVLTWTGAITHCVPITFDLTFTPHCVGTGGGNPHANVWTDFTVNDVSKKLVTPPIGQTEWPIITYTCPSE